MKLTPNRNARQNGLIAADLLQVSGPLDANGDEAGMPRLAFIGRGRDRRSNGSSGMSHDLAGWLDAETALSQSREELRQLSAQLLTVQESERRRIAADLHDGIGQSLSLVGLSLQSAVQLMEAGTLHEAAEALWQVIRQVKSAMTELRSITMDLRPAMLDDLGIIPTLSWFFREFEAACRDKKIEKDFGIEESDVPAQLKITIFRILQEAVNNIVKHAEADRIRVSLKKSDGQLLFSVEDNGQGFDQEDVSMRSDFGKGIGLITMKERAASSGGAFKIKSAPGGGTHILISWRIKEATVDCGSEIFPSLHSSYPPTAH